MHRRIPDKAGRQGVDEASYHAHAFANTGMEAFSTFPTNLVRRRDPHVSIDRIAACIVAFANEPAPGTLL
jgi:hypothetical protein